MPNCSYNVIFVKLANKKIQYPHSIFMKYASHPRRWFIAGIVAADMVVFGTTNPHSAPSWLLVAGFLLLSANFYLVVLGMLRLVGWYGIPLGKHSRFARTAVGVFSGLVALQSIGELSPRDILVLLPLAAIAYFYSSYGRGNKKPVETAVAAPLS